MDKSDAQKAELKRIAKALQNNLDWLMRWPLPDGSTVGESCIGRIPKNNIAAALKDAERALGEPDR